MQTRLSYLVGEDKIVKLKEKNVLVCGVGGVGSFVCEALARSGIGNLDIIDYDVIDITNLNRQLMSNKANVGKIKVLEMKKRLEDVSDCKVTAFNRKIDETFELYKEYDYVIDCIDDLNGKFAIVKKCHEKGIRCISALGSAKRLKISNIKKTTLDKTRNDPLAKAFRYKVRKENYRHKIDVVYSDSTYINSEKLGSSIFVVGSVGLYLAGYVFEKLLEE